MLAVDSGMPYTMARDALVRMGLTDTQAAGAVTRQMVGQAYLRASTDLFRLSAWLCSTRIVIVWFTRRPGVPSGPVTAD